MDDDVQALDTIAHLNGGAISFVVPDDPSGIPGWFSFYLLQFNDSRTLVAYHWVSEQLWLKIHKNCEAQANCKSHNRNHVTINVSYHIVNEKYTIFHISIMTCGKYFFFLGCAIEEIHL